MFSKKEIIHMTAQDLLEKCGAHISLTGLSKFLADQGRKGSRKIAADVMVGWPAIGEGIGKRYHYIRVAEALYEYDGQPPKKKKKAG